MAAFSLVGFGLSVPYLIRNGLDLSDIIMRSLDLITTTVPPALPACLGIGISYAISRLKEKGITCIARERVNVAGRVNMICFDKTGTLTEDHLDIFGYRAIKFTHNSFQFDNFIENLDGVVEENYNYYRERMLNKDNDHWKINKHKDINSYFIENLATCHSLTKVNDKLMGDPIDIRMFESTGWILNENLENEENYDSLVTTFVRPGNETDLKEKLSKDGVDEDLIIKSHYEIGIVRRFEFTSKLMRMSVLVKNVNEPYFKVYTKGSPEKIKELCRPDTIPANFTNILAKYTMKGLRVLALSMKMVKMDYMNSQKVDREKVETNMIFLGLLIVQNKVKAQTNPSIETLQSARLKMVMATGDNMLTAISVAKECYLIKPDAPIFMIEIDSENKLVWNPVETFMEEDERMETINRFNTSMQATEHSSNSKYIKNFMPDSIHVKDEFSKKFRDSHQKDIFEKAENNSEHIDAEVFQVDINIDQLINNQNEDASAIAITGTTFEKLWRFHSRYKSSKNETLKRYYDIFRHVLKNAAIYARMAPEHKTLLVESLKEEEFTVCMCGDGANDCGALRAADVGVSLSLEEASIAAHFTSNIPDISCIIKVLREGKASLVTSIQCFKYMMLYSLIQFCAVTLLMILNSYLADNQFLICDLLIIFPLAIFLARTGAYEKLTYHIPTGALISMPIVSSIVMQAIIQFICQFGIYFVLTLQTWYKPIVDPVENGDVTPSPDNTAIFLVSNFQYIITAVAFSISRPFKKPIYSNFILTGYLILSIAYSYYIIIRPDIWNFDMLQLADFGDDGNFKFIVLVFTLVNFIMSYLIEKLLVPCISEAWKNKKIRQFKSEAFRQTSANLNQLYKIKVNV
jgi:cation-transporting ATPase 13A3/4/5